VQRWLGLLTWAWFGGGFGCLPSSQPVTACLDNPSLELASPSQRIYDYPVARHTVDARGVDWVGQVLDAVRLDGVGSGCFVGGRIEGTWNQADAWDLYHERFGLRITVTSKPIEVEDLHVLNTGDGVSLKSSVPCLNGSSTWLTVRDSFIEYAHDDAIESDGLCAAEIRDNLLNRVYSAFGFRNREADPDRDGSRNTVYVTGNLVRMQAFQNNFQGQTSHPGVWKWAHGGKGPKIVVQDNRFVAFDAPPSGTLFPFVNKVVSCENNVLLFAGSQTEWQQALLGGCDNDGDDGLCDGQRLLALGDCFTVITKPGTQTSDDFLAEHWYSYVTAWKRAHTADNE